jgi:hypothetical protein
MHKINEEDSVILAFMVVSEGIKKVKIDIKVKIIKYPKVYRKLKVRVQKQDLEHLSELEKNK